MDNIYKQVLDVKDKKSFDSFFKEIKQLLDKNPEDAMSALILAAGNLAIHSLKKPISKDTAGKVMWNFIRHWLPDFASSPLRLLIYEDMLNPAFEKHFTTITPDILHWLQEKAKWNLENIKDASDELKQHWQSVVEGKIPFGIKLLVEEEGQEESK